ARQRGARAQPRRGKPRPAAIADRSADGRSGEERRQDRLGQLRPVRRRTRRKRGDRRGAARLAGGLLEDGRGVGQHPRHRHKELSMKALSIIESAYRATLEEQDDTIVWITRAMNGAGADIDILLRGNAVNYAVKAQDASGLAFGDWHQTQPPRLADDLSGAIAKGIAVFIVSEDLAARG